MITVHPATTELPIMDIAVRKDRLRPVSEATVTVLTQVIEDHGFTVPILVRKQRKGHVLIDGAHRLETMRRMGRDAIPVVCVSCTDQEARALESSQNLAGASLSPLDDAVFLAAYSEAYQELHPETKPGVAGGLARQGLANELSSFAETIAEKRSITPRQVQKIAKAGRAIRRQEVDQLRAAPLKIKLADIEAIGKIECPEERAQVVFRLSVGNAKSAAQARRSLLAEKGEAAPVEDPVEAAFKALKKAWSRAPMAAKKRFLLEHASEVWEATGNGAALGAWENARNDAGGVEDSPAFTSRRGAA